MHPSPFKIPSPRRLFGLAVVAATVMVAGCTDGEQATTTELETQQGHLGSDFHWDLRLTDATSPVDVNGADWEFPVPFNVGTGRINSFLRVQADPQEDGFNTDGSLEYDQKGGNFTHSVRLSDIPTIFYKDGPHKEIIFDANESNSDLEAAQFAINEFDLYQCVDDASAATYEDRSQLDSCDLIYEVNDDGESRAMATDAATQGSGNSLDYRILLPETLFDDDESCEYAPGGDTTCDTYIILDVDMGDESDPEWATGSTFEEFATIRRPQVTVSKTAQVDFTRTYEWTVTKEADPSSHQLLPGESGTTEYTITVDTTGSTDSEFEVSGTITIENSSGETAQIDEVEDELPDGTSLFLSNDELTCTEGTTSVTSEDLPYDLEDGGVITCDYSSPFADPEQEDENTAVVSISDPEDETTELPDVEATAGLTEGTITEVDATVDVYDEYKGSDDPDPAPYFLGEVSVDDPPPASFTRSRTWTYDETETCGMTFDNTGSVYPQDADPISSNLLASDDAEVSITCAELTVTKSAETSLTRTIDWTIDKTVAPDAWDLFTGDSGTSEYTVSVDSAGFTDSDWAVSGTITVDNTGTFDVTLSGVTDVVDGSIDATVGSCETEASDPVTFPHTLAAGSEITCSYSADLSGDDAGTNVATAHIQDDGSFSSDPVDFDFTDPTVTKVNDEITVEDTNGESWTATGDMSWDYERTFTCDDDSGTHDNTAEIVETEQTASASVTVSCHDLTVSKDASTSLTRTWDWSIEKDIDESVFVDGTFDAATSTATIGESESLLVEWDVVLDATSTDSDWAVEGTINIANNNPTLDATLTDVSDMVSPDIAATVSCPSMTVPADGSIDCTYQTDLPDAGTRTNTATATLQNRSFDNDQVGTDGGTTDFTSSAVSVDFSTADVTKIDECVDVSDTLEEEGVEVGSEDLGTLCADDALPHTFDVQFSFGGTDGTIVECGENVFDNTASFVTNDTGTTGSASSSITIEVECITGCTLTQGYWKTHNDSFWGGAPTDETWALLGDVDDNPETEAEEQMFYGSGQTWFEVFWTPPKGNAYYNLAHQYMAAYLNSLTGAAVPTEVQDAMDFADGFFSENTPDDAKSLKGNNPVRQDVLEAAGILADYNEGLIGPGHCTENDEEMFTDE